MTGRWRVGAMPYRGGMDLLGHAHELGATVQYAADLDCWGRYSNRSRTITLLEGMGEPQWRTTLAHELGHCYWEHERGTAREERQADEYAVTLLIPPSRWGWALNHASTVSGLAQELMVLPRLVLLAHELYWDSTMCAV